mgnify:CR=1 FL=1|jgi:hypothetical protein|tara:strand:- start:9352 stop:9549 length:198 start_codon:yes stop_codon:yes gene_type:complete
MKKKNFNYYLKIINQIEKVRKKNNVNWMNLLKIGFKYAPKETKKTLTKIYSDDTKISSLVKKLNS